MASIRIKIQYTANASTAVCALDEPWAQKPCSNMWNRNGVLVSMSVLVFGWVARGGPGLGSEDLRPLLRSFREFWVAMFIYWCRISMELWWRWINLLGFLGVRSGLDELCWMILRVLSQVYNLYPKYRYWQNITQYHWLEQSCLWYWTMFTLSRLGLIQYLWG